MMRQIIKFFLPKNPLLWRVPRGQFQQDRADSRHASTHEMILMRQMYARSTREAQLLMKKHNATTAYEVIDAINRRHRTKRERFINGCKRFLRKLEGSNRGKPTIQTTDYKSRLPYQLD